MTMNRSQLRNMIDSGRAIAMDCYAIGRNIPKDDPIGPLFETDILNKSVLMKRYENALPSAKQDVIVNTLVYFPYDFDNPYDGGEVLSYGDYSFSQAFEFKFSQGNAKAEQLDMLQRDTEKLRLINSIHSLDPFLLKCSAEQAGIVDQIHDSYFQISQEDWDRIRIPIREKISKLVNMALGLAMEGHYKTLEEKKKADEIRQQHVSQFLQKIWEAKDVKGIEPFIKALQISPENAPDIFFAWKAVCYYQTRFKELQADLNEMFQWVGSNSRCQPANANRLSKTEASRLFARRERLRQKMREGYVKSNEVIGEYEQNYKQFVENGKPHGFLGFLLNSENTYMVLAAKVSVATHAINIWKWYLEQYGEDMRQSIFMELFDGLTMLYSIDQQATDDRDAAPLIKKPEVLDFTGNRAHT